MYDMMEFTHFHVIGMDSHPIYNPSIPKIVMSNDKSIMNRVIELIELYKIPMDKISNVKYYTHIYFYMHLACDLIFDIIKHNNVNGIFIYKKKIYSNNNVTYMCNVFRILKQLTIYNNAAFKLDHYIKIANDIELLGYPIQDKSNDNIKYYVNSTMYTKVRISCCKILNVPPDDKEASIFNILKQFLSNINYSGEIDEYVYINFPNTVINNIISIISNDLIESKIKNNYYIALTIMFKRCDHINDINNCHRKLFDMFNNIGLYTNHSMRYLLKYINEISIPIAHYLCGTDILYIKYIYKVLLYISNIHLNHSNEKIRVKYILPNDIYDKININLC